MSITKIYFFVVFSNQVHKNEKISMSPDGY